MYCLNFFQHDFSYGGNIHYTQQTNKNLEAKIEKYRVKMEWPENK